MKNEGRAPIWVDADYKKCQIQVVQMTKENWYTLSIIYSIISINPRGCPPLGKTSLGQAVAMAIS